MKLLIQLEELTVFLGCIYLFSRLPYKWWWFPLLLLVPDLSMLGYLFTPAVGAVTYNLVHFKGTGVVIGLLGLARGNRKLLLAGLLLFAHSSLDRAIGAGLKYPDDFWHTNLGSKKYW